MLRSRRQCYLLIAAILATSVIAVDQITKFWALGQAEAMLFPRPVMAGLNWVLVWNRGMSFGILNNGSQWAPWVLGGIAVVLLGVLGRWLWQATHALTATGLGLIMGGAIGNVADRVMHGAVVDFIDVYWRQYHWPAFNVADSAIFIGVVILVLESIVHPTANVTPCKEQDDHANEA